MARVSVVLPAPKGTWQEWATSLQQTLLQALNRSQKVDEEYEPPSVASVGSRIVMTAPNGSRWALSVSNAGATVWTAL